MEILEEFSFSNDQTSIVKRKRTKRPRPSSSTSSSGVCNTAAGGCGGGEFHNSVSISSPTTSSTGLSTTTEEEDMAANCLILLARGGNSPPQAEEEIKSAEKRFNSRKFTEMPTTTNGKVGIYVYECKTCNRTFQSFQALGGHRASHKKPKLAGDAIDRKISPPIENREEEDCSGANGKTTVTQLPSRIRHLKNKAKIHECSICGSEFGSGQALGGHMRRHRSAAGTNSNLKIGTSTDAAETSSLDATSEKAPNMLSLDLNMPAPEDDRAEENFNRFSPDKQPQLLFSGGALVDCHY